MRKNPLAYRKDGYLVPNSFSSLWFHGSEDPYEEEPRDEFLSSGAHGGSYDATFFTPSEDFAREFAEGFWDSDDSGFVYACKIKDVKIFDIDNIFQNMSDPNSPLTEEGIRFRDHLSYHTSLPGDAERALASLRSVEWDSFNEENNSYYNDIVATMGTLGYRGWIEIEAGHINVALLHPDEDVEIMWSYRAGDDRENPTVFHGGDVDVQALDPVWMAHDEANQQEGVGIYFTTNIETAKRYGPKVIGAYIDLDEFVPSRDLVEDYFTREQIAELIYEIGRKSSKEDMYYFITNWFEFPVNTRIDMGTAYVLAGNYMDTQIRYLQNELVEIDKEAFIEAWNETLGVKGTYHYVTDDEVWVAIIDPEVTVTYVA